jgi:hypothetical protein
MFVIDLLINSKFINMNNVIETELQKFCKENDIRVNVNYKNLVDAFTTVKKNSKNSKFGDFLYQLKQKLDRVPTFILGLELSM